VMGFLGRVDRFDARIEAGRVHFGAWSLDIADREPPCARPGRGIPAPARLGDRRRARVARRGGVEGRPRPPAGPIVRLELELGPGRSRCCRPRSRSAASRSCTSRSG
jgi:hypothetical protein